MLVKKTAVNSQKTRGTKAPPKRTPAKKAAVTVKSPAVGDKYSCEACGLTVVVSKVCSCTEGHEIRCCGRPMKQRHRVLTEAGIALLKKVDSGSVPMYVSEGLTRIAVENGVMVAATDTPEQVIKALRRIHARSCD